MEPDSKLLTNTSRKPLGSELRIPTQSKRVTKAKQVYGATKLRLRESDESEENRLQESDENRLEESDESENLIQKTPPVPHDNHRTLSQESQRELQTETTVISIDK